MNQYPSYSYQGYYPNYYSQGTPAGTVDAKRAMAMAGLGFVVGASGALGVNLHKMRANQMTLSEAVVDAVAKGAGAGVATGAASAAASMVGGSGALRFVVMAAAATGVVYLLNSTGRSESQTVVSSKAAK